MGRNDSLNLDAVLTMEARMPKLLEPSAKWSAPLQDEFTNNQLNPCVGTRLLSQDRRVRVWEVRLKPSERLGFHRHVLDYFWVATTPGKARSNQQDGSVIEATYVAGQTCHLASGPGEFKVHDLENIGDSEFVFTTVEFLDSANRPLPLPDEIALEPQRA
jgi:beta-alanine degradation protein BauB